MATKTTKETTPSFTLAETQRQVRIQLAEMKRSLGDALKEENPSLADMKTLAEEIEYWAKCLRAFIQFTDEPAAPAPGAA